MFSEGSEQGILHRSAAKKKSTTGNDAEEIAWSGTEEINSSCSVYVE